VRTRLGRPGAKPEQIDAARAELAKGTEKLEIIRIVEQSHLPVRRTLEMLPHPRSCFF